MEEVKLIQETVGCTRAKAEELYYNLQNHLLNKIFNSSGSPVKVLGLFIVSSKVLKGRSYTLKGVPFNKPERAVVRIKATKKLIDYLGY